MAQMAKKAGEMGMVGMALAKLLEAGEANAAQIEEKDLGAYERQIESKMESIIEKGGRALSGSFDIKAGGKTSHWEVRGAGRQAKNLSDETELVLVYDNPGVRSDPNDDVRIYTTYSFEGKQFPALGDRGYQHVADTARYTQDWYYAEADWKEKGHKETGWEAFKDMTTALGDELGAKENRLARGTIGMSYLLYRGLHSTGLSDHNFERFFYGAGLAESLKPMKKKPTPFSWDLVPMPALSVEVQRTPHPKFEDSDKLPYQKTAPSPEKYHRGQPDETDTVLDVQLQVDDGQLTVKDLKKALEEEAEE